MFQISVRFLNLFGATAKIARDTIVKVNLINRMLTL